MNVSIHTLLLTHIGRGKEDGSAFKVMNNAHSTENRDWKCVNIEE